MFHQSLLGGRVQGCLYLVDRSLLGIAHVLTVLTVSSGNLLGQRDDEPTVLIHLRRRGLALKESDRITKVLHCVLLELFG